jgi:DNA-binding response OmpR family regulator
MQQHAILLVEDEEPVARGVRYALEAEGWRVTWAPDARTALERVATTPPDLAILDVRLPGMSGFELCREIRRSHTFPVLFLTARDEEVDRVLGLELGADDYLTKPFAVRELAARVRALLRRAYGDYAPSGLASTIVRGDLIVDVERHRVTRAGRPVELTATEFEILRELARHPGRVFSREALLRAVRNDSNWLGDETTVTVHIRHLREKLEDRPDEPRYILTVRGAGYTFSEG